MEGSMRRSQGHGLLAVSVAAFLLTCCSAAPASADQWNKVQSSHFLIVGDIDHARLSYIAQTLEQFRLAVSRGFPERALEAKQPLTIVVLGGAGILEYGPGRSGNVAGYYQASGDRDYIVMASRSLGGTDFTVVLHEYQHLIVRASGARLPRWANEGLADFYSTFHESKGGKRFEIGRIIESHLRTLAENGIVPLEKFFTDDGRSMQMNEVFRVGNFYAQSWVLVHFFQFGDEGKWADKLPLFLEALAAGQPVRAAFERTVGSSLEAFEAALKLYIKKPQFTFVWVESQDVGERQLGSQRGKLSVAETETLRATLMNDPAKVQKSLASALAAEPSYRPARVLNANRLVGARDVARAAEELTRLTAEDETDLQSCGLAMFALNALGRFDQALATCTAAKRDVGINFERLVSLEGANRAREIGPLFAALSLAQAEELSVLTWRSWRYLEEGRYMAAIRAADLVSARGYGTPDGLAYQRFVKTVSACLANLCADARADLKRASIPSAAGAWVQSVFRFLTEEIGADALLKEATRVEEQTEGHAYVALDLIARGQAKDAQPHLAWVAEKGSPNVTEYFVATAHLKRLQKP
jgi:hypothetical protein